MTIVLLIFGLIFGVLFSWFLYGLPVTDGYDLLALLAVALAAFYFGWIFDTSAMMRRAGLGLWVVLIFACAYLSYIFSPYLLGGAYMFLTIGTLVNYLLDRSILARIGMYAFTAGFGLVLTIFIFGYYV